MRHNTPFGEEEIITEITQSNDKLIYIQLADWIVDEILSETFLEESQIPSVAEISAMFKINHITALKGINLLTDAGIIFKKRGIGMFVAPGAKKMIKEKRKAEFEQNYLEPIVSEAKKLGIEKEDMVNMLNEAYEKMGGAK